MKRGNWAIGLPRIREPVRAGAGNSPQQDSWALIRQRDRGRASPHSRRKAYQTSSSPSSPERGAVGSWRPKTWRGEGSDLTQVRAEGSPGWSFLLLVLLDWVHPRQEPSKTRVLALCPRAVRGTQASLVGRLARRAPPFQSLLPYHSLGDRCIVLWERPAWWLALPEILTTSATRVSVGGMNEAGCPCRGAFIFFAPRGEAWSCPVGPESGRDVDESEKTIKRPRQETLHRPRDWPSSSYLAETNALCWEVSNDLICPTARKQLAPQKWNLQSFLQAGAFHGVTHAHFSWAGREGPYVKEI